MNFYTQIGILSGYILGPLGMQSENCTILFYSLTGTHLLPATGVMPSDEGIRCTLDARLAEDEPTKTSLF